MDQSIKKGNLSSFVTIKASDDINHYKFGFQVSDINFWRGKIQEIREVVGNFSIGEKVKI